MPLTRPEASPVDAPNENVGATEYASAKLIPLPVYLYKLPAWSPPKSTEAFWKKIVVGYVLNVATEVADVVPRAALGVTCVGYPMTPTGLVEEVA